MKVEIEVDVPDGWRAVAYREPRIGEWILTEGGPSQVTYELAFRYIILEKVEPKRESRWIAVGTEPSGWESRSACVAGTCRIEKVVIERRDYENGKLVAVTLEDEGEEA